MVAPSKPIYSPNPILGADVEGWAHNEFQIIARILEILPRVRLQVLNSAPTTPRQGLIAYADGTNWNPGAGEGVYVYSTTFGWMSMLSQVSAPPKTLTGTSGTLSSLSTIINASGTFTLTLPSASGNPGMWLHIKSIANQTVNSASANVVPLATATAGTAILSNTAGKWAELQSDGVNWITMAAN